MSPGKRLAVLALVVLLGIIAGCTALDSPSLAVLRFYQAIQNRDDAGYRATMDPDLRSQPNPFFLLDALRFGAGLEGIGLGVGLESFSNLSIGDLHYRLLDQAGDRAHVQVTGRLRLGNFGIEAPFCDEHLVRRIGGRWLVSYDEAEHTAKVDRWQARWSQLMGQVDPSNIGSSLAGMLDFCLE
jgi:hypothetical protein